MDTPSRSVRWSVVAPLTTTLWLLAYLAGSQPVSAAETAQRIDHVRTVDGEMAALIDEGTRRSSVFQSLIVQLNQSDVIVYVEHRQLRGNLVGQLTFAGTSQSWRYLRVQIDGSRMLLAQIAALGHELRHAVEIAQAPAATDVAAIRQLYGTIGFARDATRPKYESDSARDAGRQVYRQLVSPALVATTATEVRTAEVRTAD
jgi:hypothetical protein